MIRAKDNHSQGTLFLSYACSTGYLKSCRHLFIGQYSDYNTPKKVYNLLAGCSCAFRNNLEYQQAQMLNNTQVSGLLPWTFAYCWAWLDFCMKKVIFSNSIHPLFAGGMAENWVNSVLRCVESSIPCSHFNCCGIPISWPCTSYAVFQHELHWIWFHLNSWKTETISLRVLKILLH